MKVIHSDADEDLKVNCGSLVKLIIHSRMAEPATEMEQMDETADLPMVGLVTKQKVVVDRPVYTQEEFDQGYNPITRHSKTMKERAGEMKSQYSCSWSCFKSNLCKWLPFLAIMRGYDPKRDLLSDVMSGITVGVMHIPQGNALMNYMQSEHEIQKFSKRIVIFPFSSINI